VARVCLLESAAAPIRRRQLVTSAGAIAMPVNTLPNALASPAPAGNDALVRTTVSTTPLFANIADELLRAVADAGEAVSIAAGDIVFRQREPGDKLYCVLSGEIQLSKELEDGTQIELRRARSGDSFGELALLDGGNRDATARVVAPSQLFVLRRDHFLDAIPRAPKLLSTVLANLVQVVRATTELVFQQELEQRVLRTEMELEKYRALAQMIAGVAHEINTPIGIVNTAASIVKQRLTTTISAACAAASAAELSDIREAIDLIEANVHRAHKLIRDFKQLSVSHVADTKETLSLIEVVNEVVGLFTINARQAKLAIEIHSLLPDAASATWVGYRGFLTQVLLNLLTNVERYAYDRETGGAVHILIGEAADSRGERFSITVRDFGRGMTPETRARIFEPFYTTGRGKGATGLGMSIVHTLVTSALNGSVAVAAGEGTGTAVTLTVPKSTPE
jgi:signal transduction histidine kinase